MSGPWYNNEEEFDDDREAQIQKSIIDKIKDAQDESEESTKGVKSLKGKQFESDIANSKMIIKYIKKRCKSKKRKPTRENPITTIEIAESLKVNYNYLVSLIETSEKSNDEDKIFRARGPTGEILYTWDRIYKGFYKIDVSSVNYTGTFENFLKNNGKKL